MGSTTEQPIATEPLDLLDVLHRFEADPASCIKDPAAQVVIQAQRHPYRPWIPWPTKDTKQDTRSNIDERKLAKLCGIPVESLKPKLDDFVEHEFGKRRDKARQQAFETQGESWWEGLNEEVFKLLHNETTAARITDLFSGYFLASELEPIRSDGKGGITRDWRKAKALAQKLGFDARPRPTRDSLRNTVVSVMLDVLTKAGRSSTDAAETVAKLWAIVRVRLNPESILRTQRRARRKSTCRKKGRLQKPPA